MGVKRRRFFKVFLPSQSSTTMKFPPAFLKYIKCSLPFKSTIMISSTKSSWKVYVEKVDNNLCFNKGWEQFVEHNSLKFGDFLAFSYDSRTTFRVRIYDANGCEKEYADETEKEYADETEKEYEANGCEEEYEANGCEEEYEANGRENEYADGCQVSPPPNAKQIAENWDSKELDLAVSQSTEKDNRDFKDANEFESSFPFFKVTMESGFRSHRNIPASFVKNHISHMSRKKQAVTLLCSNKSWEVRSIRRARKSERAFSGGWHKFTMDNAIKRMPSKFIASQGNNFHDFLLLNVPTGATWRVELESTHGELWLCGGWKQFANYYSIRPGYLLVFKYKGYSNFNVVIFDMSASEIEYPSNAGHTARTIEDSNLKASLKEESDEEESVQVLEDFFVSNNCEMTQEGERGKCIATEKHGVLQKAEAFKSEKPFFMVHIGRSYISRRASFYIPIAFAKRHMKEGHNNITLQVQCGRIWSGICKFEKERKRCVVYWPSFVRENGLKLGNICVFELINQVELCFKVHIFRAN